MLTTGIAGARFVCEGENRLESTSRSCQREVYQIKDNGDIADGEIHIPWNLLQEAIAQLREAQELMRRNSDAIADSEHDLADAEF